MTTLTTIVGPNNIAPKLKQATYQILLDSSYPTGGEEVDISGDFDYVYAITFGGNDALADNQYSFAAILPAPTVAVASDNVLISCHFGGTTGAVMEEFTNTGDLSDVGQLSFTVWGS